MKKSLVTLCILALIVVCTALLLPNAQASTTVVDSGICGADGDNLVWTLDSDGLLTISGVGAMNHYTYPDAVPWHSYHSSINKATVGHGVTTIGDFAFYDCSSLTSVSISGSVTSVSDWAFCNCINLNAVNITDLAAWCEIKFEGNYANPLYYAGNLYINGELATDITIPNSVTTIGNSVFADCSSLTSVNIPEGVITIGFEAFFNCSNLTSVTIPESITNICDAAFYNCSKLQYNLFFDGMYLGNDLNPYMILVETDSPYLESINIHSETKILGSSVFYGCSNLKFVTIPNNVITIGSAAFYGCRSLTTVTIPDSVTTIGDYAFNNCSSLVDVYYLGAKTQWDSISIGSGNTELTKAVKILGFEILSHPVEQTVIEVENAQFIVEVAGSDLTYQWQHSSDNGVTWINSSSASQGYDTDTLTVVGVLGRNGYLYRCQITDNKGEIHYTDAAKLTVLEAPLAITAQPANQTVELGKQATFAVAVNKTAKAYRWQYSKDGGNTWLSATSAMTGYKSDTLTLEATKARNGYLLRCKVTDQNGNEIYSDAALLTVEDSVTFVAHPQPETVKLGNRAAFTVAAEGEIKAYQWQYQIVENGPWWNCTQYTQGYNTTELNVIAAELRQGFLYRCRITDSFGNKYYSETAELTVDIPATYAVLSQPKDTWVMPGRTTTFHIDTQGEGLTYQWEYHKGVDKTGPEYYWIAMGSTTGCKTDTLTIAGISGSTNRDGWAYRCVVTDPNGYIYTTDYAFLYVASAQIDSQPEDVNAVPGTNAVFTVETSGEVVSYQWQYSKDGGKSWYNSSSATQGYNTDTLTVGATAARNGFTYRCKITDSEGNQLITAPAQLTVE